RLVNFYGTTETPQVHGWYDIPRRPAGDVVPIGRGLAGSDLLILDRLDRPAAVGELGELVVRSRRLATGYLDRQATDLRFGRTPGSAADDRFYRTGDLGRHRPDGTVVLAGRGDDQVKIRGFRVELGDVESALTGHPDVRAAAAVAVAGTGERAIRAFAVPAHPEVTAEHLLTHLRAKLPEHAVPGAVVLVPSIPLTLNGKVDRRALLSAPAPRPRAAPADQELRSPSEQQVAKNWRSVLGRPRIGAEENFFDVGGHSMALAVLAARLTRELRRDVSVVDLFRYPTVRTQAAYFDGDGSAPGLDRASRRVAARRERLQPSRPRRSDTPAPTGRTRP
ncbi:MAG: non-ribosomal peptide synthetase, partial [Thermocrispum sp.]